MTDKTLPQPDKDEATLEAQLQALGLNAPRVTPAMVDAMIESVVYYELTETHTICKLVLFGGRFHVTGESSTVSKENFDPKIAEEVSYRNARNKVWPIASAILANDLHNFRMPLTEEQQKLDPHVQRVIVELHQVAGRIEVLDPLVAEPQRLLDMGVDQEEVTLLRDQLVTMAQYRDVLQKRLKRAGL
jgi:hypothetical protein